MVCLHENFRQYSRGNAEFANPKIICLLTNYSLLVGSSSLKRHQ